MAASFPFDQDVAWRPDPAWAEASNLKRFMDRHGLSSLEDLQRRSTQDIEWFWGAVLDELDIRFYEPYHRVVDLSDGPAFPRWCPGGQMNIVHNLLDKYRGSERENRTALVWEGENGAVKELTYGALHREVNRCAHALRSLGVSPGERVGLFMPMTSELVVALLAVVKIGAVALPLFSGFGAGAVAARLNDAGAGYLVTADAFRRRDRLIPMKRVADEALAAVSSVKRVLVVRYGEEETPWNASRDVWWHDVVPGAPEEAETYRSAADEVMMLLYTSGTTGAPKGAVHTHCGFPVKAAQDMFQCMDVRPGNRVYWMTDMGWMMGPWLVFGTLLIGAAMVLYDGAPDYPGPDRVWSLVERHRITLLGVSPSLVRALKLHGDGPVRAHDISTLRAIGSTGSPWDPESWTWLLHTALGGKKPILNYSGGTEISGGIVCGNFLRPLKPCAFSGPVPGMDADVVDTQGRPVRGEVGELVIRSPWIGMTRGFWNAPERYLDAYWKRHEGVWVHGDFAAVDRDGLWYILGRSDDTVNVAGKRVGPAEFEAVCNAVAGVAECAAVGVPDEIKGEAVVVFVVPAAGAPGDERLRENLLQALDAGLGKALRPQSIRFTTALPKTRNAKVMRRLIRSAYLGLEAGDTSSLEDPSTLDAIRTAR